jgi:hypothetical protein
LTSQLEEKNKLNSKFNDQEVELTLALVKNIYKTTQENGSFKPLAGRIGIVTPYNA